MNRTGATLAVHALEELGIEHTFGIPGVHNTELYDALCTRLDDEAQLVVDDGKHTFLASELFSVHRPCGFISPTGFNPMGYYCVPAAIGAKLANPDRQVTAIAGDGTS